jgi:hypothetical protein
VPKIKARLSPILLEKADCLRNKFFSDSRKKRLA